MSPSYNRVWTALRIRYALIRNLDWYRQLLIPEFSLGGGQMDLCQISAAGYCTEYEIKISRADWKADTAKAKWDTDALWAWSGQPKSDRSMVSRFFYVVPETLAAKGIPDWVRPEAGVLVVHDRSPGYDDVRELRPARRLKARKINEQERAAALNAFYFRYWRAWEADYRGRRHSTHVQVATAPAEVAL